MNNRKHTLKRVVACAVVVFVAITATIMSGVVGIELPETFETKVSAADTFTEGLFKYTVSDGEATITGNTSYPWLISGDIVIPDMIGGYPVTSIGDSVFGGCSGLTSITIPDSVTSIGYSAFYNCSGLTSVTIPDSVTSIGYSAFDCCTGLTSITIPDSVTSIGIDAFNDTAWYNAQSFGDVYAGKVYYKYKGTMPENTSIVIKDGTKGIAGSAFDGRTDLTSVTIPDSVTSIGDYAFRYCRGLTSVTIPDSVTSIGYEAFYACRGLTSVTIGNGVTSTGESAFEECTGLTSITIPDSVTSIGDGAFNGCSGLTSVTIPDSVTSIGWSAFAGCYRLTSITIPNSVTSIGGGAFNSCSGLTSVTIPDSVTSIGDSAFGYCRGLTSVTIGNSVTSIGSSAFENCTGLIRINWNAKSVSDSDYSENFFYNAGTAGDGIEVIFGDNVKNIPARAFYVDDSSYRPKIKSVTIGNSVTSIGSSAFFYCTGLTSVTIPDSVTSIGSSAFGYCRGLTSVTIGNGVTSIGNSAFYYCTGLTSVTIGNSVTSMGRDAFYWCWDLTTVNISDLASWCKIEFKTVYSNPLFYADNLYINGNLATNIIIPDGVTSIGFAAFYGCDLTSVTIGNGVETISSGAFGDCPLTTIKIGKNVKTIKENAFNGIKIIPEIYYAGSEEDWKNIEIDQSNDMILRATMYYNADITHKHSYTSKITKAATCTTSGIMTYTCSCGNSYMKSISKMDHTPGKWIVDKAATCTAKGSKHKECTVCKTKLETAAIPATGHTTATAVKENVKKATCTANGSYDSVVYCSVCKAEISRKTVKTDKLAHTVVTDKAVAATCIKAGKTEGSHCKVCGTVFTAQKTIAATGHSYKTAKKLATVSTDGKTVTACTVCGYVYRATTYYKASSIQLSATVFTYNGKVQRPSVTVKNSKGATLKNGTDYTVSYSSGCTNTGRYAVKVTFKGNYTGSKTLYFYILPGKTSSLTVAQSTTAVKATWKAVAGASGYIVTLYSSNNKVIKTVDTTKTTYTFSKLSAGTVYKVRVTAYKTIDSKKINSRSYALLTTATKPGTPTLKVAAGTGKAALSWNKQPGATGYVVYMATSKNGKYTKIATVKGNGTVKFTKSGLTKGKTYYFKVAAYETVGGKTIYGSFSSVKYAKIK